MTKGKIISHYDKKLIVYGDSYTDISTIPNELKKINKPWFINLVEHYSGKPYTQPWNMYEYDEYDYLNRGISGSSPFYSYCKFKEDINYYTPEKIVFLFSAPTRVPLINGPGVGWATMPEKRSKTNINRQTNWSKQEKKYALSQIRAWYEYFITEEKFIQFYHQSIYEDVQKQCQKRNISLVFIEIMTQEEERIQLDKSQLQYPFITNLRRVTDKEMEGRRNLCMSPGADARSCHLNDTNNLKLSQTIIDCFNLQTPRIIEFDKIPGLDYSLETFKFYEAYC